MMNTASQILEKLCSLIEVSGHTDFKQEKIVMEHYSVENLKTSEKERLMKVISQRNKLKMTKKVSSPKAAAKKPTPAVKKPTPQQ